MSVTFSNITPFAAAKIVNIVLARQGVEDFEVRPQMMYNYAKKNIIASNYETRSSGEKIYFEGASFKSWLDKYVQKVLNGESTSRTDYDTLAEQFIN
jgi:hypothetical protein